MPQAGHQTISYLSRRFAEAGVRLEQRHGQNFLIDGNLLRVLVERAAIDDRDVVLEVGTGTGSLAELIAPLAAALVTVEIDERLHQLAREELVGRTNVAMLRADVLAGKHQLNAEVVAAVEQQLARGAEGSPRRLKLVANLPYNVATPLVANLLRSPIVPVTMTVTVQKEVADRMAAAPDTKHYGALSVWLQSQCRVELVRTLPASVFWPRPKVTSAIVHLEVDSAARAAIDDREFFHAFVRAMFLHRRKFVRSVLASAFKGRLDKHQAERLLAQAEIDPQCRAEQIDVAAMLRLCRAVAAALPAGSAP